MPKKLQDKGEQYDANIYNITLPRLNLINVISRVNVCIYFQNNYIVE